MRKHTTVPHCTERAQTLPISRVHLRHSEVAEVTLGEKQILPPQGGAVWVEEHLPWKKKKKKRHCCWDFVVLVQNLLFLNPKLRTDQFLPLFSQKRGLPEFLADPQSLQLQAYWAGVGGDSALCNAQLFIQQCAVGTLAVLSRIAAVWLLLASKHCCTELILQRGGGARSDNQF